MLQSRSSLACLGLLCVAGGAVAQQKPEAAPKPGDAMIEAYLAKETARLSERFLDGAKTLAEWKERRPRLKQEYFDMLGLWPLPERTPLHATVTGTLERDNFVVEKLHFQSKPGLYVTGNLYRPKNPSPLPLSPKSGERGRGEGGKLPAVLYVCGHSGRGRDGNKTAFQDHGMWFATNGYVCLIIDTLQLGEIPGIHHGTYSQGRWWWQALGYTPAGVECWNGVRAIDYLVSRPDVDAERIAVTGISGGGAATFWIAAADERVKCAVPVSGMSDLESYVTNKVINGHCDCMFLVNTYQWEWTTIAALVAPRPLLFANSDNDRIFPMDGNRRIIARLRKVYQMYGKPDLVDDYVSVGGHDYRPDLRVAIFKWINKHIKGEMGPVKDAEFKFFANQELRVFPEDKDVPKDAINGKVDELFVEKARVKLPEPGRFNEWKRGLINALREKSFRAFPARIPAGRLWSQGEYETELLLDSDAKKSNADLTVKTVLCPNEKGETGVDSLIVLENQEALGSMKRLPRPLSSGGVWTRGSADPWTQKSPPNYVARAHALLGLTVQEGRVWDIAATSRYFDEGWKGKKPKDRPWKVMGAGQAGILGAYAALFEPSITEVIIVDPPVSHRDGPIFLNVLRVLDIPEALGLLAPRPLTLINAKDKAFDRTAEIYKLAGAADKFQRK